MEVLEITPDWSVELQLPECDLNLEGCTGTPSHGIRVHGCAFHFSCHNCVSEFRSRVGEGFKQFKKMRCTKCHIGYSPSRYYRIVKL